MALRVCRETAELPLEPTERGRGRRFGREEVEVGREYREVGEKDESLREARGGDQEAGESVSAVDRDVLLVSNDR